MLNGIDPIIIFLFKKLPPSISNSKIPTTTSILDSIPLPAIPIYLSERLTGIVIDSEDKNIDISTDTVTTSDGGTPETHQRGIQSTVTINMKASRESLGVSLFSAMSDLVFNKVTSKEYSITYLHGAVTVFGGLLHSFGITQNASDDLFNITLTLINTLKGPQIEVPKDETALAISPSGNIPIVPKAAGTTAVGATP